MTDNSPSPAATVAPPQLTAELEYLPFFNLAFQQNDVPAVRELKLTNRSALPLSGLVCTFTSSPEMILPKTIRAEEIAPGETLSMHDLGIELDFDRLTALSEAVKGKLKLDVSRNGETLCSREYDVTAFAADQWTGTEVMPELLAAFVTPNLDVISDLQARASEELRKATGDASIDGYRSGKRERVYEICAAIYRAVYSWGIHYSLPPSSIGTPGQRIRFADNIFQYKLGTCLDTTVLFASVMEQCGLHPVIMLHKGHAYIGCHLADRYFPDIPMDDLQAIRKLVDLDEFLVLETTVACAGGNATFSQAEATARTRHLNIDEDFHCAIDVCRARHSGIRPLPLKRSINGLELAPVETKVEKLGPEGMRTLQEHVDLSSLGDSRTQSGRVRRWTQKLLDLSLRNRLLNVRDTKQIIPIACTDITALEDKLAADESITLNTLSNLLNEKDIHDLAMLRNSEVKTEIKALLDAELDQHRLWSILPPQELGKRLVAVYRQSKSDLEEGGVNTLFLAAGFLEWKQTERDTKSYLAPILLIPIQIRRKSVAEGFRISRLDEDTMINETLLELLRSQFQLTVPGLDPLPTDESGVDVARVMQIFRQTLKDMKGWEVREEARIGLFSFGKFIMWNDMTVRQDDLRKNAIVNHLIEGGGIFDDGIEVFPPEDIARHLDLKNLCCPMSADSSQLAAVVYSGMGKSFVLHGPPGTGKSQTITNIIAHNLALGRRVLFVSEKKAALDVVHNRLTKIGLRPFCLELHSNKAGKTDVLKQFAEAVQIPECTPPSEWDAVVASMEQTREELNRYVRELHKVFPNGLSAYDCFSRTLLLKESPDPEFAPEIDFLTQRREDREIVERLAADLAIAYQGTSPDALDALRILNTVPWSPVLENAILKSARALEAAADLFKNAFAAVAPLLSMPPDSANIPAIRKTAELTALFPTVRDIPANLVCKQFAMHAEFLKTYLANDRRRAELEDKLKAYRLDVFPQYDFPGIADRIAGHDKAFFLVRFFKNNALLKELAGLKKNGGAKLTMPELKALLPDAGEYVDLLRTLESGSGQAQDLLGAYWNAGSPDWNAAGAMLADAEKIMSVASEFAGETLYEALRALLPDAKRNFAGCLPEIQKLQDAATGFDSALKEFTEHSSAAAATDDLDTLRASVRAVIGRISDLRASLRYFVLAKDARDRGLAKLAAALENGTLDPAGFAGFCDDVFSSVMLAQILTASPVLSQFDGATHNDRIRKFSELDDKYTALSRKLVFAKLAASLPRRRSGPCPEGTELGMLKRECEKRARQKPVRQLLEQIPTLAPILKPCFLMSPLSVAQYLPPDAAPFDLIVFDEASQIPVWDAIGVIARGRQLIVVGDPKQMPPTSFFQKQEAEDADETVEDAADLESILDECIAAGVYPTYLNWHYRSRHESLIAFSNHYYYEDRLFTFPAATTSDNLGVRFEFVPDGVYDRKSTRTNPKEAKAVVTYVFDRLEHSRKKRSIGVVTFSQAQKDLIEDLMEEERKKHPALESYFSDKNPEPFFVKNLENVQGDERDVILFSIGYAPDAAGRFAMNFGPLNRQGGERRLNVAITRAKEQVVVFSSIHANQIDLARTGAVGAAHLKFFLDYAEKGVRIQHKNDPQTKRNGLAMQIAGFLAENGYETEQGFGSSEYSIDIAVRNPDRPERFLLAIECDGSSYAAQRTTRDREHLRPSVLRSLGWHTCRAWSVDWAFARKHAEHDLLQYLGELRNSSEIPEEPEQPEPGNAADGPSAETGPDNQDAAPPARAPAPSQFKKDYVVWHASAQLVPDMFYAPESRATIRRQIREIVQTEGPIYESLLKKRITKAWGFARAGGNIAAVLRNSLPDDLMTTANADEPVYWPQGVSPVDYRDYRVGTDRDSKRTIDEIPPEEIANAMYEVLVDFASCEHDVLFRETIRMFGLNTLTAKARQYLEYAVAVLQRSGRI